MSVVFIITSCIYNIFSITYSQRLVCETISACFMMRQNKVFPEVPS